MRVPSRTTARIQLRRFTGDGERARRDRVAVEEPLEIRLRSGSGPERPVAVTMRTPGHDFELVAGFLYAERLVTGPDDVREIRYCTGEEEQHYNIVTVELQAGVALPPERATRGFTVHSSCGVCGKGSIEEVQALVGACLPPPSLRVDRHLLQTLPDVLRAGQGVFEKTGGSHGAGLFTADGTERWVREDVGRHNAVDKVVGAAFLERALPLHDHVLVVSGRTSFEIIQKAAAAGVHTVCAVGAPSSLAVELARNMGMTLVGFTQQDGFNLYAGDVG